MRRGNHSSWHWRPRHWLIPRLRSRRPSASTIPGSSGGWPLPPEQDVARGLAVVGLRLALNERRRRRRWGFLAIRETDASWALEVNPDLWRGLQALDPRTRAALVLTVLDGYTQDEVAAALGVPRGTVASWLSRARDRLRPVFEERVP